MYSRVFVFYVGRSHGATPHADRIALEAEHPRLVEHQAAKAAKNPNIEYGSFVGLDLSTPTFLSEVHKLVKNMNCLMIFRLI